MLERDFPIPAARFLILISALFGVASVATFISDLVRDDSSAWFGAYGVVFTAIVSYLGIWRWPIKVEVRRGESFTFVSVAGRRQTVAIDAVRSIEGSVRRGGTVRLHNGRQIGLPNVAPVAELIDYIRANCPSIEVPPLSARR